MNDLRLFLLVCGICVIVGIYIWGTLQSRRQQRQQTISETTPLHDISDIKIASTTDTDVDYSSVLQDLNQSISASREEPVDTVSNDIIRQQDELLHEKEQKQGDILENPEPVTARQDDNEALINNRQTQSGGNTHQQIIILHIIPRGKETLDGKAILHAVETLDMLMGEMQIFHHYGVGEMKMEKALFSLANMMEPGVFNIENMENFATPGLVLFMSLPTVIDEQVVFELMLNTAQRMAEMLGADICDENRDLINENKIESIRSGLTV